MKQAEEGMQPEAPHAVDAERSLLGSIMLSTEGGFENAVEKGIHAEHFFDRRHQAMFMGMTGMHSRGTHIDPVTLAHWLRDNGELQTAGGPEYIAALADIGASPVNVPAYVHLVIDTAMRRAMIAALSESHSRAFRPGESTAAKILDEAEGRLLSVGDRFARNSATAQLAGPLVRKRLDLLAEIAREKDFDRLRGLPTGFPGLDEKTAGLHGGDLVILAGRPGAGKTAFALNIVRHVTATGAGVLFFSLEMSSEQLVARLLSQGEVDAQKIRTGRNMTHEDFTKMAETAHALENRALYIDDSGTLNTLEMGARARRLARSLRPSGGLGLVVVDYLQLLSNAADEAGGENRATQVAMISRNLKALARDLNVPVIALSQLNRAVESRPTKTPMLSDLRESGAIEQDADLVLFLHGKERTAEDALDVNLIIAKQRNGPVGTFRMNFYRHYSLFRELDFSEGDA